MQEFDISKEDGRPLYEWANHGDKHKHRPNNGPSDALSDLPGDTHTSQINFGSLSLIDIQSLSRPNKLELNQVKEIQHFIPALLLDYGPNHTEHHFVATGSHGEITSNPYDQADACLIFPDLYSITEDSIFQQTPVRPHVALATLIQNVAGGQNNSHAPNQVAQPTEQTQEEQSAVSEFLNGLGNVVGEIGQGCAEQVTEHPLECLVAATGAVAGSIMAVAAAPWIATGLATAGIVASSAEVLAAIGFVGAAATTNELLTNASDWYDAALVVANPEGHSTSELTTAQSELHEISDFMVEQASGFVGGLHAPHFTPSSNGLRKGIEDDDKNEDENEDKTRAQRLV